jgi:hypothetical protein
VKRVVITLAAVALAGCQSGGGGSSSEAAAAPARAAAALGSHVVVIVMENKELAQLIGSRSAPYANALARRYALATGSYAVRHPSLPNYFALTSGSTLGIHSDCTGCQQSASSVVDQLEAAGLSWKAYMGGAPRACFKGAGSGRYAKKHDPFMYYRRVADDPLRCAKVVPGAQLVSDARARRLPAFSFVSPDLCADTHDCPVGTGDRYLAGVVPAVLGALGPRGFLVLTYDEGVSNAGCCGVAHGGRIATVVAGPTVRRGARVATPVSHYSTLRTMEDALGLAPLRNAARAAPLDGAFTSPPRLR